MVVGQYVEGGGECREGIRRGWVDVREVIWLGGRQWVGTPCQSLSALKATAFTRLSKLKKGYVILPLALHYAFDNTRN